MDRLLFGDNQFFGVNHMSEEKARAQPMRFQDIDAVIDVLDAAYDEGIRTFMCTTHDRIALVCDHVRADPERYPNFRFYPCMPYAHKYANAVTENGMLGAVKRFLPDEGFFDAAVRGGRTLATKDIEGMMTLLIDAEMKMFDGVKTPVDLPAERDRRPAARASASTTPSASSPTTSAGATRRRAGLHHDEPAGAARRARRGRDRATRSSASTSTRSGSACAAASRPTSGRCAEREFRAIAMSVFASGAIPPAEAIEWVCALAEHARDRLRRLQPRNIREHAGAGRRSAGGL